MRCWICKRTKDDIINDLFNLVGKNNKLDYTKELISNGIEFLHYDSDDTQCISVPICCVCNSLVYESLSSVLLQYMTEDEVRNIIKEAKVVFNDEQE